MTEQSLCLQDKASDATGFSLVNAWAEFLTRRKPKSFHYLFAFDCEIAAPTELRTPFRRIEGLRTWRPVGTPIDDLHFVPTQFVVAAAVPKRLAEWEALPGFVLLSVIRDGSDDPEVLIFHIERTGKDET